MVQDAGSRLLVARGNFRQLRLAPDSDAPAARALAEGEVRLRVAHFALTANNVTYAAFGEAMKYWQFFPTDTAGWGCVPVWGFAVVAESRAEGVSVGRRLYGYLPMGTHLVVQPSRTHAFGFTDASAHRTELAAVYNQWLFCDADPGYNPAQEGQQAVLRPLFMTSFLIDDFLADAGFFGAAQVLLSSASSKTAWGTAFCLSQRGGTVRTVGLTSPAHLAFTQGLGCYGSVLGYDQWATLDRTVPTVYVDFAGNAALRRSVHEHFGHALAYSCAVGGTHWAELGAGSGLPGPRPVLFFAPAQMKKRTAPPPAGWGAAGFQQRVAAAWGAMMARANHPAQPWLTVSHAQGADAVQAAWLALLDGHADPRAGTLLSL